jgi:integrase
MTKINLTDTGVRSLQPPQNGQKSYWDSNLPSFGVRVSQGGTKTFVLNRDNSLITIGRFGLLTLSEARTEAKRLMAERTLGKVRPQSVSFQTAFNEFIAEKKKNRRKSTVDNHKDRMSRHFAFKCKLGEITHGEIIRRLARIGTNAEYDHARAAAMTFFTWAHNRRYIDDNPTRGITARGSKSRSRVLSDEELLKIWTACSQRSSDLPANYCTIVKLLILTGQRRGEIAALQSSWIKNDTITLPKEATKNHVEHLFPISSLCQTIISEHRQTVSNLIFPARAKTDAPFNGWSKSKVVLDKACGVTKWTLHDFRRTYRSNLARLKVPPHIAERLINHVSSRTEVEKIYDRHLYLDDMRDTVEKYDAWFRKLISGQDGAA